MLENLRRKSLTKISKIYCEPIRQVAFYSGYARYENQSSIEQYKQRFSKEKITKSLPNPFTQVSKGFKLILHSLGNVKFNTIYCPKGSFIMGHKNQGDDNIPRIETIDRSFLLGETEVTQELYEKVMNTNPSKFKNSQNPVEQVSWGDAIQFCNKLSKLQGLDLCYTKNSSQEYDWLCDFSKNGYRLPEEKEWEYAAKAGTQNLYAGTDDQSKLKECAWYRDGSYLLIHETVTKWGFYGMDMAEYNSYLSTHLVATKKPNEWGFYDMSGNVKEWCWDKYNPKGNASATRVNRGGGWDNSSSNLLSAFRDSASPGSRPNNLGFRVCRSIVN